MHFSLEHGNDVTGHDFCNIYVIYSSVFPTSIATDDSGKMFIAGFSSGVIMIFTKEENKFKGTSAYYFLSNRYIKKLCYNEKSSVLATISTDNKLGIFNLNAGHANISFNSEIKSVYVDDNADIFLAFADHSFKMFHSDCNKIYKEMCSQVKRDLTEHEWQSEFGNDVEYRPLDCKK